MSIKLEYFLNDMMSFTPQGLTTSSDSETGIGKIDFDVVISAPAKYDDVQIKIIPQIDGAIIEREVKEALVRHRITIPKPKIGNDISGAVVLLDRRTNKQRQTLPFVVSNHRSIVIKPNPCWARKIRKKYMASCMMQIKDKEYLAAEIETDELVTSPANNCAVTFKSLKKGVVRLTLEFDAVPQGEIPVIFTHGKFRFTESVSFATLHKPEE